MRKTIVYLALLAVLAACIWYVTSKDQNMYGREAGFTVADTAAIGKIFLVNTAGKSVLLERMGDGTWQVNGAYRVMPAPLNTLLKTLARQAAEQPVPQSHHNMVVKNLAGNSTKVELYDRKGKQIRVFYVGEEAPAGSGSYMLIEGAARPFIVNIPLFEGSLTPRYSADLKDWRDRTVFRIPAEDITEISVQYVDEPLNSFKMQRGADGSVTVSLDPQMGEQGEPNMSRVQSYLGFFADVNCEGYTNGEPFMDSMLSTCPRRCIIDVIGKNGYTQHVTVFWRPLYRRSKNLNTPVPGHKNEYDADRYFAVFNDNRDTAVIQEFVFGKIFRAGYEFFQHSSPAIDTTVIHEHRH